MESMGNDFNGNWSISSWNNLTNSEHSWMKSCLVLTWHKESNYILQIFYLSFTFGIQNMIIDMPKKWLSNFNTAYISIIYTILLLIILILSAKRQCINTIRKRYDVTSKILWDLFDWQEMKNKFSVNILNNLSNCKTC